MKRLLALLVPLAFLGACRSSPAPVPAPSSGYGAATARAAVEQFLTAIQAGDLQAISTVWGNEAGPLINDQSVARDEIEKRELLMICFFKHDQARVLDTVQSGEPSHVVFQTEISRGEVTRRPTISTVRGPAGRWFVVNADIQAVRDFCQPGSSSTGRG